MQQPLISTEKHWNMDLQIYKLRIKSNKVKRKSECDPVKNTIIKGQT